VSFTGPGPTTDTPAAPQPGTFVTAVVVDFVSNPASYDLESLRKGQPGQVLNDTFIDKMPRNSIIGKIISDGEGQGGASPMIMYPFFPPYISLPVKPGEQVWVFFEKAGDKSTIPYWICRKATDITVDDINYTHLDRVKLVTPETPRPAGDVHAGTADKDYFSFNLGGGSKKSNNTLDGDNPYEDLIAASTSYSQFTGEAVPRFSKRAPDLVLQGSNNTLITLGEDRTSTPDNDPAITSVGSIDIVAGRGQDTATAAISTSANARGYVEINKTPVQTGEGVDNPAEGDPDFSNDLSRLYLSMGTDADSNFGISIAGVTPSGVGPAIVLKTDQARIIARNDLKIMVGESSVGASVVIKSDGNIIFIPGASGVIKLGGEDANKAILCTDATVSPAAGIDAGAVTGTPIISTAGGSVGNGNVQGIFASKVVVK